MSQSAQPNEFQAKGLEAWFVGNPIAANLLMVVLLCAGALSAFNMKTEEFPAFQAKSVNINVSFPGATPTDVEDGVLLPIEQAMLGMAGVKRVQSYAYEGFGQVVLEAADFVDVKTIRDEAETLLDGVRRFLPDNAEAPTVSYPTVPYNVVTLALLGDLEPMALRRAAQALERDLLAAPGISMVSLFGTKGTEILIEIDEDTLQAYGLTFDEIAGALRSASLNASAGEFKSEAGTILLRTDQRRTSEEALGAIVLRAEAKGQRITLADVASVTETFSREEMTNTFNGEPSILVQVMRSEDQDLLGVKQAVDDFLATYQPPIGVEVVQFQDQTASLRDRVGLIASNGITGFVLVLVFLALVVDLRLAFWISIGIATAFLGGFIITNMLGVSMNALVLFGLLVAIGLVVDDAIVVGEAIDKARAAGTDAKKAALKGLMSVRAPVFVGVATTIAAFSPLLLAKGEIAEFVRHIPIVVISTLLVSLLEAFFILPSHLAHGREWSKPPLRTFQRRIAAWLARVSRRTIAPLARKAALYRYGTVAGAAFVVYIAFILVATDRVRVIFFPNIEPDIVSVSLIQPVGTTFDVTKAGVDQLEDAADRLTRDLEQEFSKPIVRSKVVTTGGLVRGTGDMFGLIQFSTGEHLGSIQLELIPSGGRTVSATDIARRWRDLAGDIPGAQRVSFSSSAADFGADISFELSSSDQAQLTQAVAYLSDAIDQLGGVDDISVSTKPGKREYIFSLTSAGEASGLTTRSLAKQMRQAFFGEEIDRLQRGREELLVNLRYSNSFASSPEAFEKVHVRLPDGSAVPLLSVATITEGRSARSFKRVDGRRVTSVRADVDEAVTTPNAINKVVTSQILPDLKSRFPSVTWRQSGAAEAQQKDLESIAQVFAVVIVVIYGIVAVQMRSYILPLAVLLTIPIALAGAIFAHALLGLPISFLSLFGVIAVAGVSVNASIVFMDDYLKSVRSGIDRLTAAAAAARRRFRPILLTTLTTSLGVAPIISETSPQAQFLVPIAVSLGGGILFCGAFVLFTTPAVALILEDVRAFAAGKHTRTHGTKTVANAAERGKVSYAALR